MSDIYKSVLLDHFHNPRNKGDLDTMSVVHRGSNPRCGDDIEVGIKQDVDGWLAVRFRGRGCSVCLASASMMGEALTGANLKDAERQVKQMLAWLEGSSNQQPSNDTLGALNVVRNHPARAKCATLAWKALDSALKETALETA